MSRHIGDDKVPDGRYPGDFLAVLDHDPAGGRKPFRVRAWIWWRQPGYWRRDEPTPPFSWYECRKISDLAEPFDFRKDFRRLDRALEYLYQIRAYAEYHLAAEAMKEAEASRRITLA